jgi:hypothetical protein
MSVPGLGRAQSDQSRNLLSRGPISLAKQFLPAHHSLPNWPKGLRIDKLHVLLEHNIAVAEINSARLGPPIPLDQLARFLNEHVQGAVGLTRFVFCPMDPLAKNGGFGPSLLLEVPLPPSPATTKTSPPPDWIGRRPGPRRFLMTPAHASHVRVPNCSLALLLGSRARPFFYLVVLMGHPS